MTVHSFEVSHINSEQEKVNNVIGAMKTTYDQFSKLPNPTNIVKHVNVSKLLFNIDFFWLLIKFMNSGLCWECFIKRLFLIIYLVLFLNFLNLILQFL